MTSESTSMAQLFAQHAGSFVGTNGFRMMPGDALATADATATVSLVAGANALTVAYTLVHPDDGPQDWFLMVGADGEGAATALWCDSWHQQPAAQVLEGTAAGNVRVSYTYAEVWRWEITLDPFDDGALLLQMDNVVPDAEATDDVAAGPYAAMVMRLTRA